MFADRVAFVDLETTGMSPTSCAITEIGIVLVSRHEKALTVTEWSSLVNPQRPIPPEIQFLTGITNAMVADAPSFPELAPALLEMLQDSIFVAHHARFDYGFIKQAFAELGIVFTEKTLCTVRLSKLLDPDRSPHSLDALIHRHKLGEDDRHRALGDARLIYRYLTKMYTQRGAEVVEPAVRRLLKQPSLPAHLPSNALTDIPNTAGVYKFLGVNDQPLYIGKSIHLRERIASHFVNDHRSERGVRLSSEIRRIDWQLTAGDFGAQLLEQRLIRTLLPSHNAALRRKQNQVVLAPICTPCKDGEPDCAPTAKDPPQKARKKARKKAPTLLQWRRANEVSANQLPGYFGPFGSRASGRHWLIEHAAQTGICLGILGLERTRPGAPCFNRQLGRCLGCCTSDEPLEQMLERLRELVKPLGIPAWPFPGGLLCRENGVPAPNGNTISDWHAFDDWCYLGSAASRDGALELLRQARREFDADSFRLLHRALATQPAFPAEQILQPADLLSAVPALLTAVPGLLSSVPAMQSAIPTGNLENALARVSIREWDLQFSAAGQLHVDTPAARGIVTTKSEI